MLSIVEHGHAISLNENDLETFWKLIQSQQSNSFGWFLGDFNAFVVSLCSMFHSTHKTHLISIDMYSWTFSPSEWWVRFGCHSNFVPFCLNIFGENDTQVVKHNDMNFDWIANSNTCRMDLVLYIHKVETSWINDGGRFLVHPILLLIVRNYRRSNYK